MKKLLLFALIASASLTLFAQSGLESGNVSVEVGFTPLNFNSTQMFYVDNLKIRYGLDNGNVLRLNMFLSTNNSVDKSQTDFDNKDYKEPHFYSEYSYTRNNAGTFHIDFGYEKHFMNYDALDVYLGGELGLQGAFASGKKDYTYHEEETNDYSGSVYTTKTDVQRNVKYRNTNGNDDSAWIGCRAAAFAGANYFITEGLYIGTELSFSYGLRRNISGATDTNEFRMTDRKTPTSHSKTEITTNMSSDEPSFTTKTVTDGKTETVTNYQPVTNRISRTVASSFSVEPTLHIGWVF